MSSLPTDYCTSEYLHTKRSLSRMRGRTSSTSSTNSSGGDDKTMAASQSTSTHQHQHREEENVRRDNEQHRRALSSSMKSPSSMKLPSSSASSSSSVTATVHDNMYNVQRLKGLKINYSKTVEKRPFVIGVCGGSASGKTTVCSKIVESLSEDRRRVVVISQDSFYKSLSPEDKELADMSEYNFDHPDAFDYELFEATVEKLSQGKSVQIPVYDFVTHSRLPETYDVIMGADVVIVEGILNFYSAALRDLYNLKIFVDTDADTRLVRRIRRDIIDRGRDLGGILVQYERFVKPSFDDYILPTKKYADIVIPRGGTNIVAINLLTEHIKLRLQEMEQDFATEFKLRI